MKDRDPWLPVFWILGGIVGAILGVLIWHIG